MERRGNNTIAIYVLTQHGLMLGDRLMRRLDGEVDVYVSERLKPYAAAGVLPLPLPLRPFVAHTFNAYACHIYLLSVGAVVRLIAPLLRGKEVDPAVLCIDEAGRYVVPVLSGHIGRANEYARRVATLLRAQPVISTASDVRGTFSLDILGREFGWAIDNRHNLMRGYVAVIDGKPVAFVQETGEPNWWPPDRPLPEGVTYATSLDAVSPEDFEILLVVTDREFQGTHPAHWAKAIVYRPKSLIVGLGCGRGAPCAMVERGIQKLLAQHQLSGKCIRGIATIDKKQHEDAFTSLTRRFDWPMQTYSAATLEKARGVKTPSAIVRRHMGTGAVAEPAALLSAGAQRLLVPKQKYTEAWAGGAMTLAVARVPFVPFQQREAPSLELACE